MLRALRRKGLTVAFALVAFATLPVMASEPIDARYFGIHLHRADTTTAWPFVRFDTWRLWDAGVDWAKLEPTQGKWNFEKLDRLMALAHANKVEPLLTLGVTPTWAAARPQEAFVYGPGGASEPRNLADWENYIRTVATRYKGRLTLLEVWNEPKYGDIESTKGAFFSGTVKNLVDLACSAYRVAKEVDPAIRIVGPGFTGAGDRLERFLEAGGKRCVDVIGFHFYVPKPEQALERIRTVRKIMRQQGVGHLQLWNTEQGYELLQTMPAKLAGFEVVGEALEAAYIVRSLALGADAGLSRFYFYSWERLSHTRLSGAALQAMSTTVRWLRGGEISACQVSDGVWTCNLERGGRKAWLAWSANDKPRAWQIPPAWGANSFERYDGPSGVVSAPEIELTMSPILIKQDKWAWLP
jgi:hypothetical protein